MSIQERLKNNKEIMDSLEKSIESLNNTHNTLTRIGDLDTASEILEVIGSMEGRLLEYDYFNEELLEALDEEE